MLVMEVAGCGVCGGRKRLVGGWAGVTFGRARTALRTPEGRRVLAFPREPQISGLRKNPQNIIIIQGTRLPGIRLHHIVIAVRPDPQPILKDRPHSPTKNEQRQTKQTPLLPPLNLISSSLQSNRLLHLEPPRTSQTNAMATRDRVLRIPRAERKAVPNFALLHISGVESGELLDLRLVGTDSSDPFAYTCRSADRDLDQILLTLC